MDKPCATAECVGTGWIRRRPNRTAVFIVQHRAPALENTGETGNMSALTAYVNEALESLVHHLSSLRRDYGSTGAVV